MVYIWQEFDIKSKLLNVAFMFFHDHNDGMIKRLNGIHLNMKNIFINLKKNTLKRIFQLAVYYCLTFMTNSAESSTDNGSMPIHISDVKLAIERHHPQFAINHSAIIDRLIDKNKIQQPLNKNILCDIFTDLADEIIVVGIEVVNIWLASRKDTSKLPELCEQFLENGHKLANSEAGLVLKSADDKLLSVLNANNNFKNFVVSTFFMPAFSYYRVAKTYALASDQGMHDAQIAYMMKFIEKSFSRS